MSLITDITGKEKKELENIGNTFHELAFKDVKKARTYFLNQPREVQIYLQTQLRREFGKIGGHVWIRTLKNQGEYIKT